MKSDLGIQEKHRVMLLEILNCIVPQAEVWAFGSRVKGNFHNGSDLDLVLRNTKDISKPIDEYVDLLEALQESRIPFLVEVHDWARLPDSFHKNIEEEYVILNSSSDRSK